ncbi:MAG: VWA domain-containing protein [Bacteroidetes bacterium]|nr:VWA domain-containing protein [Bacteroidota bacterium]
MESFKLLFESPQWLIIPWLILAAGYAFILYQKNGPWGKKLQKFLMVLRFVLVACLLFLLLSPFVKQTKINIEEPVMVFAIDNSSSLKQVTDSVELQEFFRKVKEMEPPLRDNDCQIEYWSFDGVTNLDDLKYSYPSTDLNQLLKQIQLEFEDRNLAGVVLFSDGIYNQGTSPLYVPYSFEINTVAMGDTVPKTDINLRSLVYNKLAYQGNKFPLEAEIINNGFVGKEISVVVFMDNRKVAEQRLILDKDRQISKVRFSLDAENKGMQHIIVRVSAKPGEFSHSNNTKHAYVDVVEGKERILIIAHSPHPDIKAIKSAIEKNKNYHVQTYIPGIHPKSSIDLDQDHFDLIIFHQLPALGGTANNLIKKVFSMDVSTWFIVGNQNNLDQFNRYNRVITVDYKGKEKDQVTAVFNNDFDLFNYHPDFRDILVNLPPVTVPFGKYRPTINTTVLLYQKVGSIITKNPLLIVHNLNGKRSAVMAGEGLWRWRLQNHAQHENTDAFDELISKLVQYLSSKEDKRKFKVYPVKKEVFNNESVVLQTDIYNDVYEKIYGKKVDLIIGDEKNKKQKYSYTTNEFNSQYKISGLEQGVYNFNASTLLKGKKEYSSGVFTVRQLQIENLQLTADHQLLRELARRSGGKMYHSEQLDLLQAALLDQKIPGVMHREEDFLPIINLKWILFLLVCLVSIEWFIRKYNGSY